MIKYLQIKFIVLATILFCNCICSTAFAQWKWQHPAPQGNDLTDVYFIDANTGWACGEGGALIKSINGGNNWSNQYTGFLTNNQGVYFFDATHGYLANENNFLYSADGGSTWTIRYRFSNLYFEKMFFLNKDTGWVSGEFNGQFSLYRTIDGGNNWNSQVFGISNNITSVQFLSTGEGWLCGENGLYASSSNYGVNWNYSSPSGINNFNAVYFIDTQNGYIAGDGGLLLNTSNGGTNWSPVTLPNAVDLNAVYFSNTSTGVVLGANKNIFYTTNGGLNWNSSSATATTGLAIKEISNANYIIVGLNGAIATSVNSGSSWTTNSTIISQQELNGVTAANSTSLFACGNAGKIVSSVNSGNTWNNLTSGTIRNLNDIAAGSVTNVAAVADSGYIYYTTNSGTNWLNAISPSTENLNALCKATATILYTCGNNGVILKSINSGAGWSDQPNPLAGVGINYLSIFFTTQDTGYVGTDGAEILYTYNGGIVWNLVSTSVSGPFNSVHFVTGQHGFAATGTGDILESTDAGLNWAVIYSQPSTDIRKIVFTDAMNGWYFADGKVYRSIDGGFHWGQEYLPSAKNLNDAVFLNNSDAIAVGDGYSSILSRNGDLTQSIATTLLCTDNSYTVNVVPTGTFNPGNIFTVQLSDEFGNFDFPVNIGSQSATTAAGIPVFIPAGFFDSPDYRIRVISSDPVMYSSISLNSLTYHTSPDAFAYTIDPTAICNGDSVTIYATIGGNWTYQWYVDGNIINGATNDSIRVVATGDYTVQVDDGTCSAVSGIVDVLVSVCNGITEYSSDHALSAYPNPTNGIVTIKINDPVYTGQLIVTDIAGRILDTSGKINGAEYQFDMTNYLQGVYFIQVTGYSHGTIRLVRN